jgi:hypothetical protein
MCGMHLTWSYERQVQHKHDEMTMQLKDNNN